MLKSRPRKTGAPPSDLGAITVKTDGGALNIVMSGHWDVATIMANEKTLIELEAAPGQNSAIDISAVDLLDTVGAIAVSRIRDRLARSGDSEIIGAHGAQAALLDQVCHASQQPLPTRPQPTLIDRIGNLGEWAVKLSCEARNLIGFFGELSVVFFRLMLHPRRLRVTSIVSHMQTVGINAMPIVGLLAFLVGIVLTFISGDQLRRFGAGIFIVNLLGIGVLRELGILITAIIVAGRSGSAFAAEIGTMKINQEVDAMRTIGLDPMELLVVPRTLALMVMLVPLGFFANIVMIAGGAVMANLTLDITFSQFLTQFQSSIDISQLWIGMLKTPFFAFVIAMVGCFHGLQVSGSAESVGQQTTQSVVQSIFLVITLDAIFAVVFSQVGL